MRVVTPQEMSEIDGYTIREIGIPGVVLMENAAYRVTDQIIRHLGKQNGRNVVVFVGTGNNGGDGFAVARQLHNKKFNVIVYIVGDDSKIKGDALVNYHIVKKIGILVEKINTNITEDIIKNIMRSHVVVDAILGTGLKGEVRRNIQQVIEAINKYSKYTIAVDIPSGIDGGTGRICGTSIKADITVTFQLPKIGHLVYPGRDYTGELIIADIGIPPQAFENDGAKREMITKEHIKRYFGKRSNDTHKGSYGRVLVIGGSTGMTGAPTMTAQAALRSGCGLVKVAVGESLVDILENKLTEGMTVPLKEQKRGVLSIECISQLKPLIDQSDAIVFGPGIGTNEVNYNIIGKIIRYSDVPVIIDADGLNVLAGNLDCLKKANCPLVITPHPGEMARLKGVSIKEVQSHRLNIAEELSKTYNIITILKGASTVIASPEGKLAINNTGNPGMSTAGMGDVLAGIIASFIAQGIPLYDACYSGVFIHGVSGDQASKVKGEFGLIASDVIGMLPKAILCIND